MNNWIQSLPLNTQGRDFAVSDIHGCYKHLKKNLEKVGFDPTCDRVLPVGDLVDRGPENEWVLDWLAEPWFLPVKGNHEAYILKLYANGDPTPEVLNHALNFKRSGFDWWGKTSKTFRRLFLDGVSKLPIATQVETRMGRIGLIHADVPAGMHWDQIGDLINAPDVEQQRRLLSNRERVINKDCTMVPGVARVYVGHNIVPKPMILGNTVCIDTGAYQGRTSKWPGKGSLSIIRLDVDMLELEEKIHKCRPKRGLLIP
jgi:serine/threonine protein phosphatase 1